MASERIQRRIERLLDQAEEAADKEEWQLAAARAREVLTLDERNQDALALLTSAERMSRSPVTASSAPEDDAPNTAAVEPTAFANGRYEIRRFLGEGGKKRVYLAHDAQLDRDVAFALIKTEGFSRSGTRSARFGEAAIQSLRE